MRKVRWDARRVSVAQEICRAICHPRTQPNKPILDLTEMIMLVSYINITKDLALEVRRRMELDEAKADRAKRMILYAKHRQ